MIRNQSVRPNVFALRRKTSKIIILLKVRLGLDVN